MPYIYIAFYENKALQHTSLYRKGEMLFTSNFIEKTEDLAKAGKGIR